MKNLMITAMTAMLSISAFGQALDAPYTDLIHPKVLKKAKNAKKKNDIEAVINLQSPVKSQGSRGTCSIFSATALLEAVLKRELDMDTDLSEEWLEFIAMRGRTGDGSNSYNNFNYLKRYSTVSEETWAYDPNNWVKSGGFLAEERCGHLEGTPKTSCLLGHRDHRLLSATEEQLLDEAGDLFDPEFLDIKNAAEKNKQEIFNNLFNSDYSYMYSNSQIKSYLDQKIPLTMGISFYYGAWNHRLANSYGIGSSSSDFSKGIVGYPEVGSLDRKISQESDKRAGHSVVIVGYDDDRVVTTTVKMADGTTKEFTYKGVYYFKNSWGTSMFGSQMEIDGVSYPGYGMITQKYAHEFGSFYKLPVSYSQK